MSATIRMARLTRPRQRRPGAPPYTLRPAAVRAYDCRRCGRPHREDQDARLYRDHCCYQIGAATRTQAIP